MNMTSYRRPYPDITSVPTELAFGDVWNHEAIAKLIRKKSTNGEKPAFLFLGREEAALLKAHLAEAFGEESVLTVHGTYYLGLDVVTIDCERFVSVGGSKPSRAREMALPMSRSYAPNIWELRM